MIRGVRRVERWYRTHVHEEEVASGLGEDVLVPVVVRDDISGVVWMDKHGSPATAHQNVRYN